MKNRTRTSIAVSTLLFFAALSAGPARADDWEPRQASEVLMVRCFDPTYTCSLTSSQAQRINRDGTTSQFAVPPGKAFVVTSIEVTASGGTPGAAASVFFYLAPVTGTIAEVMRVDGVFNSEGEFTGAKELTTGVVFNASASPQFYVNPTTSSVVGRLTGFLTRDR